MHSNNPTITAITDFFAFVIATVVKDISRQRSGACYRCGRMGHWIANCYARTHINGYNL